MKKKLIVSALAGLLAVYQPAAHSAGIPVIDVSSLTQQILQVQHMLSQIQKLQDQLTTANTTLNRMSGSRGLANVINTAYDTSMNVNPQSLLSSSGIRNAATHGLTGSTAALYDSGNLNAATWLAQSQKSLQQSQARFADLSGLVAKVNNSPDQKDILDLQARISAEQVFLQNEQAKLSMLQSQAAANEALHRQRVQQMAIESIGSLN